MNWYTQSKIFDVKNSIQPLVKTAFKQETWDKTFGDYQRFVVDAYDIKVYLTFLTNRIAIAMNIYNMTSGGLCYQQFWSYASTQEKRARKTYKAIVKKAEEVVKHFTEVEEYAPNSMIAAELRAATWEIDRDGMSKTNIPWINYSIQKAVYEKDWRSSIYGTRYPKAPSSGY